MTPAEIAEIHAAAFTQSRAWTEDEFATLLASPYCFLCSVGSAGFALGRVIADEVELLTIAVAPDAQQCGIGRELINNFHQIAKERGAVQSFLEVAEDNVSALALYLSVGYAESGRRMSYYKRSESDPVDALTMIRPL